jgi:uncharacterized membrane protein
MGPLKILLVILGFFVVAFLIFFAGSFLVDYIAHSAAAAHKADQANGAATIVPIYFFAKFVICPIASIAAGAIMAWKIAKSDLTL